MDQLDKATQAVTKLKGAVAALPKLPQVPSIKPVPSPSISSGSAQPAKIPGVGPDSKKDPKKIAEQLKAGQPPKAKIKEILKTDKNGQWSIETVNKAGMFTSGGERIPARELQQPNLRAESKPAKTWSKDGSQKQLAGTSIGQGESVREGKMDEAKDAAQRALKYQKRLPKPKLDKADSVESA